MQPLIDEIEHEHVKDMLAFFDANKQVPQKKVAITIRLIVFPFPFFFFFLADADELGSQRRTLGHLLLCGARRRRVC